ncbi:thioredoxin-like domain-containing protein [Coraliomargarita akajimensis]|nr:thioredoxin-like domain-containing protein [Coraliomargarita akajimensis]
MRVILCVLLVFSGLLRADEFRTWTIVGGGYFEAKLKAVGNTTATLENREGRTIDFPLSDLKPSDQEYVRTWQSKQKTSVSSQAVFVERSEFAERVFKDLVYSKGKRLANFKPEPTDNPKYFAFYFSAQWCPPCRKFTPKLVDFYKKHQGKGAHFEVIFVSSDRSEDEMARYMKEYDMEWPAFELGKNKDIVQRNGSGIPNLVVTDAQGNKILDSYDSSGKYTGPSRVLAELEDLL